MKLFVRFKSHAFREFSLAEGNRYSLGRNTQCDIHLPYRQVSRDQGFIYHDGQSWVFEDHGTSHPKIHRLTDMTSANLKNGLEVFTEEYLNQEKTFSSHTPHDFISTPLHLLWNYKKTLGAVASCFVLLTFFALIWFLRKPTTYNSQTMMSFAENKVVKFELKYKAENIERLKKEGNFSDEDIRHNIGFCTGFIISKNTILTAHHCLSQAPGFSLIDDFNILTKDKRLLTPKRVLGFDFVKDYLFLEVEGLEQNDKPLKFASASQVGEKVFTIGNVAGEGIAIREGIIAGFTEDPNDSSVEYVRFSAAASPGNSGGPLLNERGEIVALVSKKNFAENYNIGIRFQDLREGFKDFVTNEGSREIKFSSAQNDLDMTTLAFLLPRFFGFKVSDSFTSRKDIGDKFKDFQVTFKVPFQYDQRKEAYFGQFMSEAEKLVAQMGEEVAKNSLPGTSWETQPTKDFPVIAPVIAEELKSSFKLVQKKWLVPSTTGLIGHSGYTGYTQSLAEWKKNKNYVYPDGAMAQRVQLVEHRFPNDGSEGYLIYSSVEDTKDPVNLTNMFYMSPDFSVRYISEKSKEEKQEIVRSTLKKVFFADSGGLLNLKLFPFIRSKAKNDLKLMDFPGPIHLVGTYPDRHNRGWDYYQTDFYGAFFVEAFCHDFTQTTHCLTVVRDGDLANVQLKLVENFIRSEFSDKMALLEYYAPSDLKNLSKESEISFRTTQFQSLNSQTISVTDKSDQLSYQVRSSSNIELVRPHASVQFSPQGSQWKATGFHFIRKSLEPGKKLEFCTTGVEQEKYKTNTFLNISDTDLTRLVASISGGSPDKKSTSSKYWRHDLRAPASEDTKEFIYGSCFPMRSQPNQPDTFTLDPYKGKPFSVEVGQP